MHQSLGAVELNRQESDAPSKHEHEQRPATQLNATMNENTTSDFSSAPLTEQLQPSPPHTGESLPEVIDMILGQHQGMTVSLLRDNGLSRVVQYRDAQGDRTRIELRTWLKTLEIHNELGVYAFVAEQDLMDLLASESFEHWVKARTFEELPDTLATDYGFRYRPSAPRVLTSLKSEIREPNLHILWAIAAGIQAARSYKDHVAGSDQAQD